MPDCRSISIALHSQFDVETLPEYYPAPKANYIAQGITGFIPELTSNDTSTCSVYIPVLPGSTFWISYSVSPPVPAGHYFLFKLYIDGTHIMNWSTGKEEKWRGKTMFGLYERSDNEEGKRRVEKRVLCFTPPDKKDKKWKDVIDLFDENACVEIKVHRAHGRKRVEREMEEYKSTQHAKNGKGVSLVNAGRAGPEQPKRFYKFALIDPVDQPFATFRYYYRTWDQLRDLGLLDEEWNYAGEDNDLSVIEPIELFDRELEDNSSRHVSSRGSVEPPQESYGTASKDPSGDGNGNNREDNSKKNGSRLTCGRISNPGETTRPLTPGVTLRRARDTSRQPGACNLRLGPDSKADEDSEIEGIQRLSYMRMPPQFYGRSVSLSMKLGPPEPSSRPLPALPRESDSSSSKANHPHAAYPGNGGTMRATSPVIRETVVTPPCKASKDDSLSASSLIHAISSTWRRMGTQISAGSSATESRDGARSVP